MERPPCFVSGNLTLGLRPREFRGHHLLLRPYRPATRSRVRSLLFSGSKEAPSTHGPVLILPGLGTSSTDYVSLASRLAERGHSAVSIAPVARWKWSLNARSFFMVDYWRRTLRPQQVLEWYFECVDRGVEELAAAVRDVQAISILGHSAGGWLGRAYLAERAPEGLHVSSFITLGTPNRAPPKGRLDQTRGLLEYIEQNCEVSELVEELVCVAGRGTVGKPLGKGSMAEYVAYLSYTAVCGDGDVDGDGVTPVSAACAENGKLLVCDDCDHSMLTSQRWYGEGAAYHKWVRYLS